MFKGFFWVFGGGSPLKSIKEAKKKESLITADLLLHLIQMNGKGDHNELCM